MPPSFLMPRYRSFGHLRRTRTPTADSMPSASATPAAIVVKDIARGGSIDCDGARTIETYSPLPGGEYHLCPRRPRPAVCSSANTTAPSESDAAASFVDSIVGKYVTLVPNRPSRG